ncbi:MULTISPECIES: type I restriction endonuclease subunit R [Streptococcus]|uniref:type I restriction endonuclease subunit R n=1 Tax=Streptococcus TaxID=1301 RepID=UPI00025AA83D|nr:MULTISPECIES: type I restriction endonuclease subunit R [Streptococcus]EID25065.1 type I site-specific deoxyribonuclease, HsdR family [Streptococcus oralis SK1074]EJO20306.1 type I site-specific deoxyribonuclease, HsdR family [Streptococcus sp. BS35b]ETS89164.1 type I site-specific deoxyribonuclease, HsdR family [Streptococcus sp. BS29a]EUB28329.1 type I site-specific deoxyribonuclease, HsdR family [Streptococcus sp. BS21]MCY7105331.1 type I restriction endonuclease subunit R [Streptococcus
MSESTFTTAIVESDNFIILEKYTKLEQPSQYQTEADLEKELIADLRQQGYEYLTYLTTPEALLANLKTQMEVLNNVVFTDAEWLRFLDEYLNKPSDSLIDRTRKLHDNYIYDFIFDDGHIQNIYLWDKKNISRNKLQVINQMKQVGISSNRYDVTLLVNGLPLVQIELKKRGVAIREAFNQVHRYSKESFNEENSLFKYLQIFIISNGTDTRYFANTTKRDKNSYEFTMNWALKNNNPIKDLKDFTATFLSQQTLLNVLINYSVFDTNDTLLIMRPYQIAATERIIWKIRSAIASKIKSGPDTGGYIWHTTGSGKTLTSFKAARLATEMEEVDKVFFVVDRKDLDYQTMKEYQRFSPDSVNGSNSTAGLKRNIEKDDNKIVVTTIQKLNNFMSSESQHEIYQKQVVFIFDECHRSQFGEAQKRLRQKFKKYCQFGFTGTPIKVENALGSETTASVFGRELHAYVLTDAIRDQKVLKFMVDYNDVRPKFKSIESEQDLAKLSAAENKKALLHPTRIAEISRYVLDHFDQKTHRLTGKGFNAMFAVSSVDAAKAYYQELQNQQKDSEKPLKIATIFSYAVNESQVAIGEIDDESFSPEDLADISSKEFLSSCIADYNQLFGTNFTINGNDFQNYYRDLAKRVKNREVDLLIVVGMFLTGFDAPTLNTLFVDKNLRYHGLIQAFSRTNRIYDATKSFGNIVTFRDLEKATTDAIKLFGKTETAEVLLERSYQEYMTGFTEAGEEQKGYMAVVQELQEKFPDPQAIIKERDKKEFVSLFGQFLRLDNILQNYDDFMSLRALQELDISDDKAVEAFKERFHVDDETLEELSRLDIPSTREIQDYRSTYNDIKSWYENERRNREDNESKVDWDSIVFEVELLKSQEINLDYILELIFETNKKVSNKDELVSEITRTIRASLGNRAKEDLIVAFIHDSDLDSFADKSDIIEQFFIFAQGEQKREADELIQIEGLNEQSAKRYIQASLKREYASENGNDLNEALPKMSPLNPQYRTKKQTVFQKISRFVEKFKGIGGDI